MERKIGEMFRIKNKKYIVEKDYLKLACGTCDLYKNGLKVNRELCNKMGICKFEDRSDNIPVIAREMPK
jgi:hypothetical protein